jgi:catechol-2,3-dioxygenase
MTVDYDNAGKEVKRPSYLAHVVLRTNNLKPMAEFYKTFLGAHASYENDYISFMTYDEEHHRIALIQVPGTAPKNQQTCGLEHIAFTYSKLEDLALSYRQRKANGIEPVWCINHGPTTSIYYHDPDGNELETQIDNFDTNEELGQFLTGEEFAENPIGTDFDPEDLIRRLQAGEDHAMIKKRVEIGPRHMR